jgi:hypothetical protein
MCHFGLRRKKQYHIYWKGYSNAVDTWEPEENVHAPELLAQYHKSQEMNIRTTRMEMKGSMIQTGHLQSLKKLSQCLAVLRRLTYGKSNKLHNNMKIIYVILGHLGTQINPRSCDLV